MQRQRAEEIAHSPDMQRVTYNGKQVYIQQVDKQNDTARIFNLDNPEHEFDVQITNLNER